MIGKADTLALSAMIAEMPNYNAIRKIMTSEELKKIRIDKGWSQNDLAKLLGYKDRSHIARLENGYQAINERFSMSVKWLCHTDAGSSELHSNSHPV